MKDKTITISNERCKEELGKTIMDILKTNDSTVLDIKVKNDRINGWQLRSGNNIIDLLDEATSMEIEEVAFYVGSKIIDEHNSFVDLHVDKVMPYEVTGKVFKEHLTIDQQIKLGVKGLSDDLMLEFSATVETESDYELTYAYIKDVEVFSSDDKKRVKLNHRQYDATNLDHELTNNFAGKYDEDRAASWADSYDPYGD